MASKNYEKALLKVNKKMRYPVVEAISVVKNTSITKFDSSIDLAMKLNLDTTQSDQQLRGSLELPHGNGKKIRILAITNQHEIAKKAGADFVGGADIIARIKSENWFEYDIVISEPSFMPQLGKIGQLLGPKGLMPNPKSGTLTQNIGKAISSFKKGRVQYRTDRNANLHLSIARVSFENTKILENYEAVFNLVKSIKPAAVKGFYIKNVTLATTMGPSVKVLFN